MSPANDNKSSAAAAPTVAPRAVEPTAPRGADVTFLYLSELIDTPIRYDDERRPSGRLYDIGASASTSYPQAVALEVHQRGAKIFLPWSAVLSLTPRETVLRRDTAAPPSADFWARRDVLDDQVVDVSGAAVRRVNDVQMIYSARKLVFAHVEVGILGILRRLRFQRVVCFLARWLFDYTIKESFVTWRHVQVLSPGGVPGGVRMAALPERLADMHPAELADVMEQLGTTDRQAVFNALPVETAAEALEEVTPEYQRTLIAQGEPARVAHILEEMPSHEAADVLRDLGPDAQGLISRMENGAAADLKTILSHEGRSAGGVMAPNCLEAHANETVGQALAHVRAMAEDVDVFDVIHVLDEERRLLGVLNLRELLRASESTVLEGLMTREPVCVGPDTPLQDVGRIFVKYGFHAIPVVDQNGVFLGAVRAERVLAELAPLGRE